MILFASTVDLTGEAGQCTATRALFLALRRLAEDQMVHLIAPHPQRPEELAEVEPEHMHLLPRKRSRSWSWSARAQISMAAHLWRLLRRGDVEAVIGRLSASIITAPLLARAFGVPYLLLARGLGWGEPIPAVRWLNARLATVIYAAFPEVRETLRPADPEDTGPIRVVPNAANTDLFRPLSGTGAREEVLEGVGLAAEDFVVGFTGRMEVHQRLDVLVEALAELRRRGHEKAKLLLMGEGPEQPRLRSRVEKLGLSDAVVFAGWIPQAELAPRVAACDVLYGVRSGDRPGSPLKIYEYLSAGRPVVVRNSEEFRFVKEIDAGVLVEEARAGPVASALEELAEAGPERRRSMGERGRSYVLEHHTWEQVGRRILDDVDGLRDGRP